MKLGIYRRMSVWEGVFGKGQAHVERGDGVR